MYRRYAGLYFCICVDVSDNNLACLEAIHNFVEVLNEYFHNVCELDLVFNFYKVSSSLADLLTGKRGRKMGKFHHIKGAPSIPETYLLSSVAWGLNLRVG